MAGLLAVLYGVVSYAIGVVGLLYTIGFLGNVLVPKSIDTGMAGPLLESVIIDTLLVGLFAVQHSVMARQGFKRWWTRVVPATVERSTYVLFSGLVLLFICWQWRPIPASVWAVHDSTVAGIITAVFWLGWAVLFLSTFLINHFELFGLRQVFGRLLGKELPDVKFRAPLLYKHVRHPIYLGFVLGVWAAPTMSVGHLLFSIVSTGYVLIGIQFEERDLIRQFGDQYRRYRQQAAMLIPLPGRKFADKTDA